MKKKIKYLLAMFVVVFAMVLVCGCDDENDSDIAGTTISSKYIEKKNHSKDMTMLDSINTAIKTYVADPGSNYDDGEIYTLTEIIKIDDDDIIRNILAETFDIKGKVGTFNAKSKAFDDITTDDVLIMIESGSVSIYVPSQVEEYNDYVVGIYGEELRDYR